MNLVGERDPAVFVQSELVFRIDQDQTLRAACSRPRANSASARKRTLAIAPASAVSLNDLPRCYRLVVRAGRSLSGRRDDRRRQLLVLAQAVRETNAVEQR